MLRQCLYCGEFFKHRDCCPWCGCECWEPMLDEDEWYTRDHALSNGRWWGGAIILKKAPS